MESHDAHFASVDARECVQCVIEGDEVSAGIGAVMYNSFIQRNMLHAASAFEVTTSGMIDQNTAHHLLTPRKTGPVPPLHALVIHQTHIRFIDQGSRLEAVVAVLTSHVAVRQPAQLRIVTRVRLRSASWSPSLQARRSWLMSSTDRDAGAGAPIGDRWIGPPCRDPSRTIRRNGDWGYPPGWPVGRFRAENRERVGEHPSLQVGLFDRSCAGSGAPVKRARRGCRSVAVYLKSNCDRRLIVRRPIHNGSSRLPSGDAERNHGRESRAVPKPGIIAAAHDQTRRERCYCRVGHRRRQRGRSSVSPRRRGDPGRPAVPSSFANSTISRTPVSTSRASPET